ncbi:MAG: Rap1a/Tai family immunity protein [Deltaproteobacteria bacterium]|nr:Rap1a/Tai family immunity protein [Deltaproteobacteria bacterium]
MKVRRIIPLGIAMLLLASASAPAQGESEPFGYFNGSNLYSLCSEGSRDFKIGVCTGYVAAIVDLLWSKNTIEGLRACLPEALSAGQARDMVKKWIEDRPALGQLKASLVVVKVMAGAFPCDQTESRR